MQRMTESERLEHQINDLKSRFMEQQSLAHVTEVCFEYLYVKSASLPMYDDVVVVRLSIWVFCLEIAEFPDRDRRSAP